MTGLPSLTPLVLRTLLLTLWQVAVSGVRVFVWESLTKGLIDHRPLGRVLRLLTGAGLALVVGFLLSILFSDVLRGWGGLEPLAYESTATRGLLVPAAAVPLTLAAQLLAWSMILTGALYVRGWARAAILLLYLLFGLSGLGSGFFSVPEKMGAFHPLLLLCLVLLTLAVLMLLLILLPRRKPPVAVGFVVMLGLQSILFLAALAQSVVAQERSGFPHVTSNLISSMVTLGRVVVIPLLLISGADMANFGFEATRWAVKAVDKHAADWIVTLLLVVLLGYGLWGWGSKLAGGVDGGALAGAAVLVAGLAGVFLWYRGQTSTEEVSAGLLTRIVVGLAAFQVLLVPLITVISLGYMLLILIVSAAGGEIQVLAPLANRVFDAAGSASDLYREVYHLLVALVGLWVAWWMARRGRVGLVAFGLVLAWYQLLVWLTEPGHVLDTFRFEYADVDILLLPILAGATAYLLIRRELKRERGLRLLGLAILGGLLHQTGFLDNPFSPFFSFAGVFFLVFSLLWGVLTAGGKYTNVETPGFPRAGRLLLYVGYVLLSVSIVHWFILSHNVEQQVLQSALNMRGFVTYGLALAFLAFVRRGRTVST